MAVFMKEMKQGWKALAVWTAATAFMVVICIALFPEMKSQMDSMTRLFANMGSFTKAFGMDRLNFGELTGFYGIECGNILGMGGGFFAAYLGVSVLSKEEKEHTAEFLMTHPVSRFSVVGQKLAGVAAQILILNAVVFVLSRVSIELIGETFSWREFLLLHGAYLLLQAEIAAVCFGISAHIRRGSIGIGLGLAAVLYFMDLICNLSDKAAWMKYITPFAYAKPADIIPNGAIDPVLAALGTVYAILGIAIGFWKYIKKDLAA